MRTVLRTVATAIVGLLVFAALLFLPAWTLDYWRAWLFIAVFTASTLGPSIYLLVKAPAALERRMRAGPAAEARPAQRLIIGSIGVLTIGLLVFSAFDSRFGPSSVPAVVSVLGDALVGAGLVLAMLVVVQNSYAAANVAVEPGQKLVATGLYGLVRHPMYLGTLVMMIGVPPALGSWWGLVLLVPLVALLVLRILDEEKMLRAELGGYGDYMRATRFRLVPYVW